MNQGVSNVSHVVIYSCIVCNTGIFESPAIHYHTTTVHGIFYFVCHGFLFNVLIRGRNIHCFCCNLRFGEYITDDNGHVCGMLRGVEPRNYLVCIVCSIKKKEIPLFVYMGLY